MTEERKLVVRIERQEGPDAAPRWEEFHVPWRKNANVISVLMQIQRDPRTSDGKATTPPAWDAACLEEVCGSCTASPGEGNETLGQGHLRDQQRRINRHNPQQVRHDMAQDDPPRRHPARPRRLDELPPFQHQGLPPHDPCHAEPTQQPDAHEQNDQRFAKITKSRITTNMNGTATRISTIRIITLSVRPPTQPATAPMRCQPPPR